ncbi:MAG: polyprenyl synthetase family protein [Saprospiraceae bacterium]
MSSLPELLVRIQAYTEAHPFPNEPSGLYEPCIYMLDLGGKRLRPALALMAYELFGNDVDAALPVAWAVELFHNFSLMHDDIMDAAPLRRGKPTVHTHWNTTTAILSGDALLIQAYKHLAAFADEPVIPKLLDAFNRVAIGVCEGQQLDLNFETRTDVGVDEYLQMIELKTAVLLGGALEMGALCARASSEDAAALYQFGCLAGIAFQIQDDLLDTYGDPAKFGKQVGGDILQNKKTLLALKVMESASAADQAELEHWLSAPSDEPDAKIAAVRALFDRNDIPARIADEKDQFRQLAFDRLDAVSAPEARKQALRDAVGALLDREN